MAKACQPYFPEQDLLLPPNSREWVPENHLTYFASDIVDELDLSGIESYYERGAHG